ncbi:MAG: site-2 protease family protein, partial [Cytophagales bacterium]|nr:site-2 protease family protein [Cytophagales bacterium]
LKKPAEPYEFRSKPAWQRLIIMLGGVTVNVILAIFIFAMIMYVWGEKYLPNSSVKYGIMCDSVALQMGLRNGDKIISLDGKPVDRFYAIQADLIIEQPKTIQVERDGKVMDITIPPGFVKNAVSKGARGFMAPRFPFEVAAFAPGGVAEKYGIKVGDRLVAVNGQPTFFFDEFKSQLQKYKDKEITVSALRGKDTVNLMVKVPSTGLLGIAPKMDDSYLEYKTKRYDIISAFPAGLEKAYGTLSAYIKQFKLIFDPEVEGYKHVGGFITIGNIFPSIWDWESFWGLTAFLSIMLAFMNVLPIPALDGGHAMFTLYEIITRKKPSDKFLEYAQIGGMALLFSLLILANGNDLFKLFK